MCRNQAISSLRQKSERRRMFIPIEQPSFMWILSEGAKGGFGRTVNRSVGFHKMNGFPQVLDRQFRKSRNESLVLVRNILHALPCALLPTANPKATEIALAIV